MAVATKNYRKTYFACFIAIINQAAVTSLTAILFVPFMNLYGFHLWQLGLLVGINFSAQMVADIILTFIIDKMSFRPLVLISCFLSCIGLVLFGFAPFLFSNANMFLGIILATLVFSFASGMLEVLISPIVDNIPEGTRGKGGAMSLMHSFYAWGQVLTIVITTVFLFIYKNNNWSYIVFFWAIVPIISAILFFAAPLDKRAVEKHRSKEAFSKFFLVAIIAIMLGGASEILMNQWASTYVQLGLGFNKVTADLLGMCLFAVFLGIGRLAFAFIKKLNLQLVLIYGSLSAFGMYLIAGIVPIPIIALLACILCGLSVSLLWPGTLVVASNKYPFAGAWIFAVLAISGDIGGSIAPIVSGFLADSLGLNWTFVICSLIPLGCFFCHLFLYNYKPRMLHGVSTKITTKTD